MIELSAIKPTRTVERLLTTIVTAKSNFYSLDDKIIEADGKVIENSKDRDSADQEEERKELEPEQEQKTKEKYTDKAKAIRMISI